MLAVLDKDTRLANDNLPAEIYKSNWSFRCTLKISQVQVVARASHHTDRVTWRNRGVVGTVVGYRNIQTYPVVAGVARYEG
jgi:hypothetical protein